MEIWKFPLQVGQTLVDNMPARARVLTVQMQNDKPTLWALVDPSQFPETREFYAIGTGNPILRPDLVYIGTVQDFYRFVWHVFEAPRA